MSKKTIAKRQLADLARGRYPGGKGHDGTWTWIVNQFASHWVYAEPFLGSGACLRNKPPAYQSFGVDIDQRIVAHWVNVQWPATTVNHGCGLSWLAGLESWSPWPASDWLIYIDAPYPDASCSASRYAHQLPVDGHKRLLDLVTAIPVRFVVSCYAHPLYTRRLKDWHCDTRNVVTHGGRKRREHLWTNYDPAVQHHLARPPAAPGFRERQDCNRQCQRWRATFSDWPAWRRDAFLAELLDAENQLRKKERGY